jgi:hypothetical protein
MTRDAAYTSTSARSDPMSSGTDVRKDSRRGANFARANASAISSTMAGRPPRPPVLPPQGEESGEGDPSRVGRKSRRSRRGQDAP